MHSSPGIQTELERGEAAIVVAGESFDVPPSCTTTANRFKRPRRCRILEGRACRVISLSLSFSRQREISLNQVRSRHEENRVETALASSSTSASRRSRIVPLSLPLLQAPSGILPNAFKLETPRGRSPARRATVTDTSHLSQ